MPRAPILPPARADRERLSAAHQSLVDLCTGILECLDQGDLWKPPARAHAADLLRKALADIRTASGD